MSPAYEEKRKAVPACGAGEGSRRVMCVKKTICWFLAFLILFSAASLLRSSGFGQKPWQNPYSDVTADQWSYQYITELNKAGILPDSSTFDPQKEESRGDLVLYVYNLNGVLTKDGKKKSKTDLPFSDVSKNDSRYAAVRWAYETAWSPAPRTPPSPPTKISPESRCAPF